VLYKDKKRTIKIPARFVLAVSGLIASTASVIISAIAILIK